MNEEIKPKEQANMPVPAVPPPADQPPEIPLMSGDELRELNERGKVSSEEEFKRLMLTVRAMMKTIVDKHERVCFLEQSMLIAAKTFGKGRLGFAWDLYKSIPEGTELQVAMLENMAIFRVKLPSVAQPSKKIVIAKS